MARYIYSGVTRDGFGNIISSATIKAYLAGTTTAASVYAAYAGGVAINEVTSGTDGVFTFYVDEGDYASNQRFKIIMSKTGYTSVTSDYLVIFESVGVKIGSIIKAMDDATGSTSYTGVGFKPSALILIGANTGGVSVGIDDGTSHFSAYSQTTFGSSGTVSITLFEDATKYQEGIITSMNADGFTISWTRTGATAGGNVNVYYLAIR